MLPKDWEIRFSDRNVQPETEADWAWCDIVIISAMIVQKADFRALIQGKSEASQSKTPGRRRELSTGICAVD